MSDSPIETTTVQLPAATKTVKRSSVFWWVSVPVSLLLVVGLIAARFLFTIPGNMQGGQYIGTQLQQATPFSVSQAIASGGLLSPSGSVVSGATPYPTGIVPGFPDPRVESSYIQQLIASEGNPSKVIVVSIAGQFLQAYDHGKLVNWTYVTTGRPGMDTPTGFFNVQFELSPILFYPISTNPSSPDFGFLTKARYGLDFAPNGYYIHDAWWRTIYGPPNASFHWDPGRGEYQVGSHGCVNTPLQMMAWLYLWTPVGTPVIVF